MAKLTNLGPRVASLGERLAPPPKTADPFYQSIEWRNLCAILRRTRPNVCAREGCGKPVRIWNHIKERRDGGAALDPSNIEGLCFKHHQQHTAASRARRAKGEAT